MQTRIFLAILGLLSLLAVPISSASAQDQETTETFRKAVQEIREALAQAQYEFAKEQAEREDLSGGPRLETATVRLRTTTTTEISPGIQLVVGASGDRQEAQTQEIVLTLTPSEAMILGATGPMPSSEELVAAIKDVHAAAQASMDDIGRFEVSSFEVHLDMIAKTNVDGGVMFELPSVEVGVEGGRSQATSHSITLTFVE